MDTSLCRPEFPLDCVEVGVRGLCSLRVKNVERWLFEAGVVVTLFDPAGLMKDYDWIEPAGYPKVPFSYTESNVEAFSLGVNMRGAKPLTVRHSVGFFLFAGYRFQYLDQTVQWYESWQYVWNGGLSFSLYPECARSADRCGVAAGALAADSVVGGSRRGHRVNRGRG